MSMPEQQSQDTRRKRIVINLNQAAPLHKSSLQRSRLWPKVLLVLVLLFVFGTLLTCGGAYFWWHHYKTTPAYSLAVLLDGAQRKDMSAVDQVLDTDSVVNDLTNQVTQKASERYGSALTSSVRNRIEALIPGLLPNLKQTVRDALATRIQELSETTTHKPFIVIAVGLPYLMNITTEGDTAKASTTGAEQPFELTLQHATDRWKVVAIKDETIIDRVVDQLVKDLPPVGAQTGEPDRLKKSVDRNRRRK
jgi:hypothetical protein